MILEEQQAELIKLHLNPSNFFDEDAVAAAAFLFTIFEDDFVKKVNKETFYLLPYKDISIYVYECGIDSIPSNTINGFATTVKEFFIKNNMCVDAEHMVKCYEKFIDHILLAFAQKLFMLKVSSSALVTAQRADALAEKAEKLAIEADRLATEADAQAKSTIANYISILGIFASIIFTLFGGVNLIGATVKLLEANSRLPYLTFIIALLMICLLTLLNMMVKWIGATSNLKERLDRIVSGASDSSSGGNTSKIKLDWWERFISTDFYTKSVMVFSIILGLSLVGMYSVKKEKIYSYSTEITQKNIIKPEASVENKSASKPQDDKGQANVESTVVSKLAISNKIDSESKDKKEGN